MKRIYVLLTIIVFCLTGCVNKDDSIKKKTVTYKESINSVKINDIDASIKLKISNDDDIHITYWEGTKNKYTIEVKQKVLYIDKIESKNKNLSLENRITQIELPSKVYEILDIKSCNGNIEFEKINSNQIIAKSDNGDINVDSIKGNDITLCSNNGDINGTINQNQDEFDIQSNIKNGKSNLSPQLKNKDKKLYVENICGNVMLQFNK